MRAYNEWLHYSEGSAMLPLMLNLYVGRLKEAGAPLQPRIDSEIANHLGYVDGALKGREFFVGTVADRRRHPDELCRRDGQGVRQARAVSGSERVAVADARAAGVPALDREGRGLPLCEIAFKCLRRRVCGVIRRLRFCYRLSFRGVLRANPELRQALIALHMTLAHAPHLSSPLPPPAAAARWRVRLVRRKGRHPIRCSTN